jgi:hypothetical protein
LGPVNNAVGVMTQQNLDFGTAAENDGETLPTAFLKIQENFEELYGRQVNVDEYGAVGGATATTGTDDSAAFQAAIDAVNAAGGGTVTFSGRHLLSSGVIVKPNVRLQGPAYRPHLMLPVTTGSYDELAGVLYLDSASTIEIRDRGALTNCYVLREGLTTPFADQTAATAGLAAYAGTAISITNHGAAVDDVLILGFTQAITTDAAADPSRLRLSHVGFDCTNGILMDGNFDISDIYRCHGWPYLTTGRGFTDVTNTRSGSAYKTGEQYDWGKFTQCFAFGYAIGFEIIDADNTLLIGCGADYPSAISPSTSVGFKIGSGAAEATLIGCQAAANGTAVLIDNGLTAIQAGGVKIIGFTSWGNDTTHVDIQTGRAIISGCSFRSGTTGISAASTAGALSIVNNEFDTLTTPLDIHATPLATSTIHSNRANATTNPAASDRLALRSSTALTSTIDMLNSADAASVWVRRTRGLRATPAANDTLFETWELADSAGNATIAYRQNVRLNDVTDTSEDCQVFWSIMVAGTLTDKLLFTPTAWAPVSNAVLALGTTSLGWNGLHLGTGTAINWANGEITLTESDANTLVLAGAATAFDVQGPFRTDSVRIDQAASTVGTGTKTISNAADSSTNFGKYFSIDLNGTTVYVPCGTVAPT